MKTAFGFTLVATLVAAMAVPAAAGGKAGPRKAKILKKYDANHDGVLDPSERAQLRADRKARRAQLRKQYDTNRDGTLQPAERAAMRAGLAGKRFDALVAKLDKNGDRALSATEVEAAPRFQGKKRRMARLVERFARADANGDGVVTRGEYLSAVAKAKAKRHKRRGGKRKAAPPAPAP